MGGHAREDMRCCAGKLTGTELTQIQSVLDLLENKKNLHFPLLKGRTVSDVSLDDNGFPRCLTTPEKSQSHNQNPLLKGNPRCLTTPEKSHNQDPLLKGNLEAVHLEGLPSQSSKKGDKKKNNVRKDSNRKHARP